MKKTIYLLLILLTFSSTSFAQEKTIKNVILMIPDGTSIGAVSAARWYQRYNNPEQTNLYIDPYMCGTVLTYSSNAPIGDSAPTTSCFMTGYPSLAGWVSTYPTSDSANDIIPMNPDKAYQPLMTVLEAARITQNKATGLVFTCEFPHATPADCASHTYNRSLYEHIVPQMVHNQLDVVIGGGSKLLSNENKEYLTTQGYGVFTNDIDNFRNYNGNKMWALFNDMDMASDIDRNPEVEPSLEEMTRIAIDKLSKNENGFFLMVEGSKIDWAAHANDAATIITEFLAFDKACGAAFEFAKSNQETVVIIVPDHGNSGITIGSNKCPNYSKLSKDELFANISKIKISCHELVKKLHQTDAIDLRKVMLELTGIEINDDEYLQLLQCADYDKSLLSNEQRMYGTDLTKVVANIIDNHTCFGFTSTGHTGEEVFLAVYDPTPNRLMGHKTNIELNQYMRNSLNLPQSLESLTDGYFAKHTDVFNGYQYSIKKEEEKIVLEVKSKKNKLVIEPNTNIIKWNNKDYFLNSVVIYVDKNDTFYLPRTLKELL